ncbi:nitrite reductase (NADH) small subunit [Propionibacterium cyclohexanicum]|uniref:Nitrite reductase (NADH) small subunit n=1 Tax=Propionibacterium cyclohexanicum TaxID=64702 RepID=A0A1H9RNL1_9ACTN|nr:nitrite reductase small subunit NirD [Propionibacterium cyclohexanicum]SER73673.1 nitrite reductase (NADH) small subunit [Propionibacterium cyclohexanicum]
MNEWTKVCEASELVADRGAAVLVGTDQVAVFRLSDGRLFAVSHKDPVTGANVMAHGLVGSHEGVPTVASPLHKEVYELSTGRCLNEGCGRLKTWEVRHDEQGIWLRGPRRADQLPARSRQSSAA